PLFGFGVGYRVLSDDTNGRAILASLSLLKAVRERIDMLDTKLELEVAAFFGTQTTLAENAIHTLRNAVRAGRDRRANNLLTGLKSAFIGSASLAGAMLGIVLALFVIISRQVLVPVARMRRMMNSISSGKLQTRLPSSRRHDEIGEMMSAIRVFKSTAIEADRLQREMSLHKSRDKANASGVARTQFLAAMSHELRTPLNAVIGFSDVMSKEMFGNIGNERYKDYAEQIHTSGQHLLSLVEDILDVSQFDLKAAKLDQSEFDPAQVLSESLRMIEQQAEKNNITIVSEIPTDLPAFIADRRRIKQVVVNLLTNAVKYNRPGGSVGLFASVNNDGLRLRITDTGIGMKRDELKKICEPFVQVAPTHTRTRDGVGLGLYLCRQMIDMHNGKLEIESEPGVGTSVTVTFPITRLKLAA
ncbi:MAG: HAMP domain-containing sensor histidine kinase, partial [Pseudomonadota bacterium]|nr:HAMP domain-containing sensor histidine kinase [Pseudomonadota bacterium]